MTGLTHATVLVVIVAMMRTFVGQIQFVTERLELRIVLATENASDAIPKR